MEDQLKVELARVDERLKAQTASIEQGFALQNQLRVASEKASTDALRLARDELARRLEALNGEASRIAVINEEKLSKEVFEARMLVLIDRIAAMEGDFREQRGKMWLILVTAAAAAASVGAAIVKLLP